MFVAVGMTERAGIKCYYSFVESEGTSRWLWKQKLLFRNIQLFYQQTWLRVLYMVCRGGFFEVSEVDFNLLHICQDT